MSAGVKKTPEENEAAFQAAKFYSCDDGCERLTHDDEWEAIHDWLDSHAEKGDESEAGTLRRTGPITVYAYAPLEIGQKYFRMQGEILLERFEEDYREEFGDPEECGKVYPPELLDAAEALVRKAFEAWGGVWQCERVAEKEFSVEELLPHVDHAREDA